MSLAALCLPENCLYLFLLFSLFCLPIFIFSFILFLFYCILNNIILNHCFLQLFSSIFLSYLTVFFFSILPLLLPFSLLKSFSSPVFSFPGKTFGAKCSGYISIQWGFSFCPPKANPSAWVAHRPEPGLE